MGGGDKRPEDNDDDNDEYEAREPDNQQVDLSDFTEGSGSSDGDRSGGGSGEGDSDSDSDSDESDIVDRIKSYVGNRGDSKEGGSGESESGGGGDKKNENEGLTATRALLGVTGIGISMGTNPVAGDFAVDVSEDAVETLYEEAREEVQRDE